MPPAAKGKRKRPAGSKWLNRLLALGCLASLSPLLFEVYQSRKSVPLEQPHHNDPWVRIIDAAPPEEVLASTAEASSHSKRFRHHPRHDKIKVRADGSVMDQDADKGGDEDGAAASRAELLEDKLMRSKTATDAAAAAAAAPGGGPPPPMPILSKDKDAAAASIPSSSSSTSSSTGAGTADSVGANSSSSSSSSRGRSASASDEEDDMRHYFREVDRATAPTVTNGTGAANGTAASGSSTKKGPSRLFRTVPGAVHDIVEDDGTVFSTEGIPPPTPSNGTYVVDLTGTLDRDSLKYMNRNLSYVDKLTPFRVFLLVMQRQPKDWAARHTFARSLIRTWYKGSRMGDRSAVIIMSLDGSVEVFVGQQCKIVLSDAVARHFAIKAQELFSSYGVDEATNATVPNEVRLREVGQKLVFYVAFTVRSRTQATAMNMRSVSMFMMMFMMMTITATKQQQARRYAEFYGVSDRRALYHLGGGHPSPFFMRDAFYDDFESGRFGASARARYQVSAQQEAERAHADAFFRMQLLSTLLSSRGGAFARDEYGEEYYDDDSGEEDEYLSDDEQQALHAARGGRMSS